MLWALNYKALASKCPRVELTNDFIIIGLGEDYDQSPYGALWQFLVCLGA